MERTGCTPPKCGEVRNDSNFLPIIRIQTQIIFSLFIASIARNSLFCIFLLNNFKFLFTICIVYSKSFYLLYIDKLIT